MRAYLARPRARGSRADRAIAWGCSREKRPDCVHENPVLCMHEFIQNSATRFISCNFTRNSNATRPRTAAPAEPVSNGSSWRHGPSWPSAVLFSQHAGDVSTRLHVPTDPRVSERIGSQVTRY
eukprot:COSAG02_NODE_2031_length_10066_cov_115.646333_4_plen_123_part_00